LCRRRHGKPIKECASCGTICLQLLKIGGLVRISVRRIRIATPSAYPNRTALAVAYQRLITTAPDPPEP
jgi:hypothetical protein